MFYNLLGVIIIFIIIIGSPEIVGKYIEQITEFCNNYYVSSERIARQYLGKNFVEDVVIAAFEYVMNNAEIIFENERVKTDDGYYWEVIHNATINECKKHIRKKMRRGKRNIPLDEEDEIFDNEIWYAPERRSEVEEVWVTINLLPYKYKIVLQAYFYNWTVKETAKYLDTSEDNVYQLRSRAKSKFEHLLKERGIKKEDILKHV